MFAEDACAERGGQQPLHVNSDGRHVQPYWTCVTSIVRESKTLDGMSIGLRYNVHKLSKPHVYTLLF